MFFFVSDILLHILHTTQVQYRIFSYNIFLVKITNYAQIHCIVNTCYIHIFGSQETCANHGVVSVNWTSRCRHICQGPWGKCARNKGNSELLSEFVNFVCHVADFFSPWNIVLFADWSVNTGNGIIFTLSCYLASPTYTCVMHLYDKYSRTCHRTNEHIVTWLPHAWSHLSRQHALRSHDSLEPQNRPFLCAYNVLCL